MVKDWVWRGGTSWLDFVNTEVVQNGERVDLLGSAGDVRHWLVAADTLAEHDDKQLNITDEAAWLATARELRAALRAACETVARDEPLSSETLATLNGVLSRPATYWQFDGDHVHEELDLSDANSAFVPLARAAAQTLASDAKKRIRACANPQCILWFLDVSKSGSRRWCSMEGCGNRAKVSAHLARRRGE